MPCRASLQRAGTCMKPDSVDDRGRVNTCGRGGHGNIVQRRLPPFPCQQEHGAVTPSLCRATSTARAGALRAPMPCRQVNQQQHSKQRDLCRHLSRSAPPATAASATARRMRCWDLATPGHRHSPLSPRLSAWLQRLLMVCHALRRCAWRRSGLLCLLPSTADGAVHSR